MKNNRLLANFKKMLFCSIVLIVSSAFAQSDIFEVSRNGSLAELKVLYNKDNTIINKKNEQGYTPLTLACYNGNLEVAAFLIKKVDNLDGNSNYGTPLMAAVYKGHQKIVEILLNNKANPNVQDSQGGTAMHYAVLFKNYEIIKLLTKTNADFNIKNNVEKSAIDFAISFKDKKLNELLNL